MENAKPKLEELKFTRMFYVPREHVWKAWTVPDKFMKWWGPNKYTKVI